jgi:glycine/D-amino acid oxidase-like deaminating enzyme
MNVAARAADVVVVGAGVIGAWTALRAAEAGRAVAVIDAFGAGDPRSSSGEESRITRASHGTDEFYARWSRDALTGWRELEARTGDPIFVPSGVVWFAQREDGFEAASEATLGRLGVPVERLTSAELSRRWPAIAATDLAFGLHEPEAGALRARLGIRATMGELERLGGTLRIDRVRPGRTAGTRLLDVETDTGDRISAGAFVFAAGPWLPRLFPEVAGDLISVTKQDVVFLGPAPGDRRFEADRFPAWIDYDGAIYGMPSIDGRGPKVPPDAYGAPFDPDTSDRLIDAASITTVRDYLAVRIPDLATRPVVETRVCQYESTPDTHFVIDRHPDFENVWLAGGGSGHAFKHGPEIGRYVAALLDRGMATNAPPDDRFSLTRDRRSNAALRAGSSSPRPRPPVNS